MPKRPALRTDRLDALARRLDRDAAAGLIAGAQVVVGRRDGVAFEHAAGWRDAAARDPLRPDAVWRIFSMTKPIVSVAAMVLVERGELRLDQPVAELIPAFADLRVAAPGGGTVPAAAAPTVQDLLRHTAGLAYGYLDGGPAGRALARDGFLGADLPLGELVERLAGFPLEHQPGKLWHYSHATEVLGRTVEVATGLGLGAALRALVLDPLGMADTGFLLPERDRARVAEPLPQPPGARPRFFDPCIPRRHESAGGGLVSTAADYARFCRMVLGRGTLEGARVLGPATLALMTADHLGRDTGRASYYPPGPGYGFGLGFAVRVAAGEAPFPGTPGDVFWSGVGGTYFWVDPARDLFAVLMLQSSSAEQRQGYRTLARAMVYAALD
ncbi:serine hydrolase domain-containing protein [Lichenibacterium dinghuense]|uniref:serine hydrolase domain-containing protein n=1 Tax=Lichenibacterium dinghuense TaxID=2895977 RepID=UPI001F350131|nr:serine hydrolase domain-containing protein [Lichenibacterium sp. 6Y81]